MLKLPNAADVEAAYERIRSLVHQTPVLSCESINTITGATIFFKCENFQKVGAFKYRGASNAVLSLSKGQKQSGVATHSSGNHAAALALAAQKAGVQAHIVMPVNAPEIKKKAVEGYGAIITFCEPTLHAREKTLEDIIRKTGAVLVHPYNQWEVICGQGTASLELMQQQSNIETILTPVGGGGLLSGTASYIKERFSGVDVIATEPINADDAYRSFKTGILQPVGKPDTIADGLRTSLGALNFEIIKNKVDQIITVKEESIIKAMRMVWERMKIIIEPSSAVPLAAVLENKALFTNRTIGIVLTGGNVDLEKLPF